MSRLVIEVRKRFSLVEKAQTGTDKYIDRNKCTCIIKIITNVNVHFRWLWNLQKNNVSFLII